MGPTPEPYRCARLKLVNKYDNFFHGIVFSEVDLPKSEKKVKKFSKIFFYKKETLKSP